MICPNCNATNEPGTRFCVACGARLNEESRPTPPPQQAQYAAPAPSPMPTNAQQGAMHPPLSTGQFMLMELLSRIPLVNLIMYIIWAAGSGDNLNRKNWAKSKLFWILISSGLTILCLVAFGGFLVTFWDELSYYINYYF